MSYDYDRCIIVIYYIVDMFVMIKYCHFGPILSPMDGHTLFITVLKPLTFNFDYGFFRQCDFPCVGIGMPIACP